MIWAFYLGISVPPLIWRESALPKEYSGRRLLPIQAVAINNHDPEVHLYYVLNAEVESGKTAVYPALSKTPAGFDLADFNRQVKRHLTNSSQGVSAIRPNAILDFRVGLEDDLVGRGKISVTGYFDQSKQSLIYSRRLEYRGLDVWGAWSDMPPGLERNNQAAEPFSLYPWPVEALVAAGIFSLHSPVVEGTIQNGLSGSKAEVVYDLEQPWDSIDEVCDGLCFDEAILFYKSGEFAPEQSEALASAQFKPTHRIWQELSTSAEWSFYHQPNRRYYDLGFAPLWGTGVILHKELSGDPQLVSVCNDLFKRLDGEMRESAVKISIISRTAEKRHVEVANLLLESGGRGAEFLKTEKKSLYYIRFGKGDQWQELEFPKKAPDTIVVDFVLIGNEPNDLMLVTDKEGLFASRGSDQRWMAFNFGESRIINASAIRPIIAGSQKTLFVLLVNYHGGEYTAGRENYLLRLHRRDLFERLRFAVADLAN